MLASRSRLVFDCEDFGIQRQKAPLAEIAFVFEGGSLF